MTKVNNKKNLRKSGFKEPVEMAGIMLLFILGVVTFPTRMIIEWFYKGENEFVFLLADGIERLIFSGLMVHFVLSFGFRVIPRKTRLITLLVLIPSLIIAVNNFPFVAYFSGDCTIDTTNFGFFSYALWCLGVGLFEELAYRGVMLPLIFIKVRQMENPMIKKRPVFFTVAFSSAVFALSHLINLLNGNIGGTFLQVGYTFLIGAMCGIVMVKTGNVILSAIVHIVYNFCGMFIEYCGKGIMWTMPQIAFTAIIGVVIGVILIVVAFRSDRDDSLVLGVLGEPLCEEGQNSENPPITHENA